MNLCFFCLGPNGSFFQLNQHLAWIHLHANLCNCLTGLTWFHLHLCNWRHTFNFQQSVRVNWKRQATADSKWCRNSRVLYVFTLLDLSPSRLLPGMFEKLTLLIALYSTRIVELRTSFNYIKSYAAAEGLNHTIVGKNSFFLIQLGQNTSKRHMFISASFVFSSSSQTSEVKWFTCSKI